jgi:hypothetical protein
MNKLFKNKRLQFALAVAWFITCFVVIRINPIETADRIFRIALDSCYQNHLTTNKELVDGCIKTAENEYRELLEVTSAQIIDMFILFILPIVFILLLIYLVRWINNYKYSE